MKVACSFSLRTPIISEYIEDEGKATYETISIRSPHGDGRLHTDHPPVVNDLIFVWSDGREGHEPGPGLCRVISRMWMHSAYGSTNWPYNHSEPSVGPSCEIIVEIAKGQYADEAPVAEGVDAT